MSPRVSAASAAAEVAGRDPALARVIELAGPFKLPKREHPDHFVALAQAIVYQQLAGRAAAAIWGRVVALFPDGMAPELVAAIAETDLKSAGLSTNKVLSLKDLAAKSLDGSVLLDRLARMGDEELVTNLSAVRGIGPWTAEMFLIFQLRRMDVWPVGDFGVRKGWAIAHELTDLPTPKALQAEGDAFRPYRTVAAWYCWQAVGLAGKGMVLPA